ncbi:GAF domain-containing sensor histidine kinase [Leptolyngbya sp. FACHB-261]|uniref:sensor histidine kinase n=1 Tax=Leptolyngbya sp. FACHB-261 TaxID=2692806 RepID=UPI00168348EC|nr:GAF domain-containing sensor histidine kinase [Leptolyngbya sp. FACHB-261]MBD2100055.1 GAF domain-containing sensor histidine kinase [Leptolyngbya sp. FACHB-261]
MTEAFAESDGNPEELRPEGLQLEKLQIVLAQLEQQNKLLLLSQRAMATEHRQYRELSQSGNEGYLITNHLGIIQAANQQAAQMLGCPLKHLIGKPLAVLVVLSERRRFRQLLAELNRTDLNTESGQWQFQLQPYSQPAFVAELSVTTVQNSAGQISALHFYLRNTATAEQASTELQQALDFEAALKRITDQVRDSLDEQQILQTAVRELGLVLNASNCAISLYDFYDPHGRDPHGRSRLSHQFSTTFPQNPETPMASWPEIYNQLLQGQELQFCHLEPPSPQPQAAILACPILGSGVIGDIWLYKLKDSSFSDLEVRLVRQVANQCAIAIRQARFYQAAQAQTQAQTQELEQLDQLKNEFLSTISHELRTPLSNIKLAINMLKIGFNQLKPLLQASATDSLARTDPNLAIQKLNHYLQILENECNREVELIEDLLTFQQPRINTDSSSLEPIQLQPWLSEILQSFQPQAQAQQQRLTLDVPAALPTLVCDASNLRRVIKELLVNACKYTPSDEEITLSACINTDTVQLSVSNTGIEIPPQSLPHLFERFYRVPNSDPWKYGGTGLGLALVQRLTEQLGGKIWVESSSDRTTFTLEWPCRFQD